ncbi:MAG: DUF3822 family protein [Flavobacteriales bacterium]
MEIGVSNISFSHIDEHLLTQQKIENCHLSLEIGLNNITWLVHDNNEVLAIEKILGPLSVIENILSDHTYLNKKYKSTNICILNNKNTFIHYSLYQAKNKNNYLSLNHNKTEKLNVLTDKIESISCYNIYGVPKAMESIVETYFTNATVRHQNTSIIINLLNQYKNSDKKKIALNVNEKDFQLIIIEKNQLIFFNNYVFHHANDFIYHLLFAYEQLKLDPEKNPVHLFGNIHKNSDLYQLIYTYIKDVSFGYRNKLVQLNPTVDQIETHNCYSILHQHLCV